MHPKYVLVYTNVNRHMYLKLNVVGYLLLCIQWQTRDRELYDCLCNLKRICSRRHVTDDIHDQ